MVDTTDLSLALDGLIDLAEAAWPAFQLDRPTFRARLLSAFEGGRAPVAVSEIHAVDLYLACACAAGLPSAVSEFAARYLSPVDIYLKRFRNSPIRAEDVRRDLEDTLLFGRAGSPPRIGQYNGRAPLERFVAVAARNAAVSMLRAQQRGFGEDFNALASQLASPPEGSESLVAARYEGVIREALRVALVSLDRRQRTIVRLHLAQGVTLTQIARMLKVHQSTVSRSLDAAIQVIYVEIRRQLQGLEGMNSSEMRSIVRDVRNRIDLSLSRVLRDTRGG
jgi:RNA polymerase sigma-70 factor, ECF subfamily